MIPLRDENPARRTPYVTLTIIVLNFLAFLLWQPTFGNEREQQTFFFCTALIPWEVTHQESLAEGGSEAREALDEEFGDGAGEQVQPVLRRDCPDKNWLFSVFAAMFLHGGWLHIGGNMLFLWIFGNNVEDKIGHLLFLPFYLGAGVAATAVQLVAGGTDSAIPNLGASGAVAGVLGAYIVMFPRRRVLTLVIFFFITAVYLPAYMVLGLWFVLQLFSGFASLGREVAVGGGVAFWAHVGGFVFGAIGAALFFPKERIGARPPPPRPDMWGRGGWPSRRRREPPDSAWY
jgi:membrane associated rhomboid family serine protease